jgi:hypothetical protein
LLQNKSPDLATKQIPWPCYKTNPLALLQNKSPGLATKQIPWPCYKTNPLALLSLVQSSSVSRLC